MTKLAQKPKLLSNARLPMKLQTSPPDMFEVILLSFYQIFLFFLFLYSFVSSMFLFLFIYIYTYCVCVCKCNMKIDVVNRGVYDWHHLNEVVLEQVRSHVKRYLSEFTFMYHFSTCLAILCWSKSGFGIMISLVSIITPKPRLLLVEKDRSIR